MQFGHVGLTVMIKVAQCQHGGSFLRLTWNPGIILFCSLAIIWDESQCYLSRVYSCGTLVWFSQGAFL